MTTTTAASRYTALTSKRDPYLLRARACAKLTIPALMPEEGTTGTTTFVTPYQSVGARGVNTLAAKMVLTLLPTNTSLFRLTIDDFALEELTQREGMRGQVEEGLGKIERAGMNEIEASSLRPVAHEAFKQLIVAGNVLLHMPRKRPARMFRLDKYVVRRDSDGGLLEAIVREEVLPSSLPEDVLALCPEDVQKFVKDGQGEEKPIALFTRVRRHFSAYVEHQEINGHIIPGTSSMTPLDSCEWLPLRFIRVYGEDYGRGYVEEYYGALKSLEGLHKAILFGAAAAAKVLFLVNPNGTTKLKDVADAESGAVKQGNANDITVMQLQKSSDFRVAQERIQSIEQQLAFCFLMNSSIQRNGERVTAEEIRFMARELEDALGGIYSILSQEFQFPLVKLMLAKLRRMGKMPALPKGVVRPVIVTGMEALGRGQEQEKLRQFVAELQNAFPAALEQLDANEYAKRTGTALGIDLKGLLKSPEQVSQERAQAAQAAMAQAVVEKGTGPAIQAASRNGASMPTQ